MTGHLVANSFQAAYFFFCKTIARNVLLHYTRMPRPYGVSMDIGTCLGAMEIFSVIMI